MSDDDLTKPEATGSPALDLHPIIEALVFAAEEPLSDSQIAEVIRETTGADVGRADIEQAVAGLNDVYERDNRAFRIHVWSGGYRMATTSDFAPYVKTLYFQQKVTKLSRSLLETLAILAYKQPATKPELDFVRGVDCDHALRRLLELDLVEIAGRADSVGRPLLYRTTPQFMDKFGLASLDDLPTLREIEELLEDPSYNREQAQMLFRAGLGLEDTSPTSSDVDLEGDGAVGDTDDYLLGNGESTPPGES